MYFDRADTFHYRPVYQRTLKSFLSNESLLALKSRGDNSVINESMYLLVLIHNLVLNTNSSANVDHTNRTDHWSVTIATTDFYNYYQCTQVNEPDRVTVP